MSIPPWTPPAVTRWALVLPDGIPAGEDGTLDEADAREFTGVVAEHLLRTPGAALIVGPAPYAGRPAQLPGDVAEWADRCAGELLPRDLGYPELRIEWAENVARGLAARAVLVPRAAGAVSAQSTVAVRWGLWLDDAALTEQESAAVAQAEGLIRIRGQWVVIDPASRDRARDPGLPATGTLAR